MYDPISYNYKVRKINKKCWISTLLVWVFQSVNIHQVNAYKVGIMFSIKGFIRRTLYRHEFLQETDDWKEELASQVGLVFGFAKRSQADCADSHSQSKLYR